MFTVTHNPIVGYLGVYGFRYTIGKPDVHLGVGFYLLFYTCAMKTK